MIFNLENISMATIVKRPSAICKTPYVADIAIESDDGVVLNTLGHTPALGCCGLSDKDCKVIVSKVVSKKQNKCTHRVDLAVFEEKGHIMIVGINPKMAESIVEQSLYNNNLQFLINVQEAKREVRYLNSRFDFAGVDNNGKKFFMEVKNVPLADYVDVPKKERKLYKDIDKTMEYSDKIAYFPDGYRKNSTTVVSERALKHICELEEVATTTEYRAILCFVIQRTDVSRFQPSNIDLTYKAAVQKAWQNGVEIRAIQVSWSSEGECIFVRDDLPVQLYETYGPYKL